MSQEHHDHMYQQLDIALANTATHECEFTRAFWLGYAKGKAEEGQSFQCYVPVGILDDLLTMLRRITVGTIVILHQVFEQSTGVKTAFCSVIVSDHAVGTYLVDTGRHDLTSSVGFVYRRDPAMVED